MKSLYLSLLLLFITSMGVGWLLVHWDNHYQWSVLVGCLLVLNAAMVTYPAKTIDFSFAGLLRTDIRAFIITLLSCILVVFLLTWLELFVDTLLVVCAGLLASLELHNVRMQGIKIMLTVMVVQLAGFCLGLFLNQNLNHIFNHTYLLIGK